MAVLLYGSDPAFLDHHAGAGHPERPERLHAVWSGAEAAGLAGALEPLEAREVTRAELERVHDAAYLALLDGLFEAARETGGGRLDADTGVSPGSARAARLAAGLGLVAIERLRAEPDAGPAFLAVRPPGHHAPYGGFCLYNNVAVAAAALLETGERVAIVDWDAHHGNGTEAIFDAEARVLYSSLHQWPLYPMTGELGTAVNLPLPPGATGDVYARAFDDVIGPAVAAFVPDWVLVSAGYDAHRADPLTDLGLSAGDFGDLAARVLGLAPGPNRLVAFLEGGYALDAVAASVAATLGTWATGRPQHPEPPTVGGPGGQIVDAARELSRPAS